MNKLYSQIASLVVIVGLGTAWTFGVIDATLFTTISVTILSAIFALYQKYEKDEVVKTNLQLEDTLKSFVNSNFRLTSKLNELETLEILNRKTDSKKVNEIDAVKIDSITEKPKKARKPKSS